MLQELIYTSAPVGLKPGSQGFCTVACTTGMPPNLAKLLETLSGYRHVFLPPDTNANKNPISCSHLLLNLGGVPWHILSRTGDAGLDYTQRTNKISHHLVLDQAELQQAGPATILTQYPFQTSWNQKPVILPANKKIPPVSSQTRICEQWAQLTGDAGWGGILAETALSKRPVSIVFRPGMNMLPLIDEAMALLTPEQRWQISFSTYCCNLPNGTGCQWKCILASSPEMAQVRLTANTLVIDLTQPLGSPPAGQLVGAARTGKVPEKQESIIPPTGQIGDQAVYGIKEAGTPPPAAAPVAVPAHQTATNKKNKSAKGQKKGAEDPSSKGCFWLIILFFILVTAGLIGGLFWFYGSNLSKSGDVAHREKNIEKLQQEIIQLQQQIANNKTKQEQIAADTAKWQEEKGSYAKSLSDKDAYINRVAGYFSLFPHVTTPPVSIDLKDGIPRKDGTSAAMKDLLKFDVPVDENFVLKDLKEFLSTQLKSQNGRIACAVKEAISYSPGNTIGYPCELLAVLNQSDDRQLRLAEFELLVTKDGIFVRNFNDDLWSKFVADKLEEMYRNSKENDAFQLNNNFIEWYESHIKDKTFVLNEDMLTKIDELGASDFTGKSADVLQMIDLRKEYYGAKISLDFIFELKLDYLADKVKREK